MSIVYLQLTDTEMKNIIKEAFAEGVKIAKKELSFDEDIIKEDEALKILNCSKSKLDKLRAEKKVTFYTASRPYTYSKNSIIRYLDSQQICQTY